MKIRKFNESVENKTWTFEEMKNLSIQKKEIKKKETIIRNHLSDFLFFNYTILPEYLADDAEIDIRNGYTLDQTDLFYVDNFYIVDSILVASITYDDGDEKVEIRLNQEQIKDFVIFINDPEIYKNSKKYNL